MPRPRRGQPVGEIRPGTMKRFIKYLTDHYKGRLLVVLVCIILSAISMSFSNVFLQQLIDQVILPGMKVGMESVQAKFLRIIGTMGVFYLVGMATSAIYTQIMAGVTQGTLKNLRDEMFDAMEKLPIKYFDTHAHGDIMSTYTNDVDAIRQMIGQSTPTLIQTGLSVLTIVFMMLRYSLWLTLVVFAVILLMFRVTKKLGKESSVYMMRQQKSLAKEEGFIEEMMKGQKVVKVFTHEEESKKEFDVLNEQLFQDSARANAAGNVLMPILGNIGNILYVLLALAGGLLVVFGATNVSLRGFRPITIGIIVSFLGMSRQLSQTIGQMSAQVPMISMALAGAGRVFQLIDEKQEEDEGYVHLVNVVKKEDGSFKETDHNTEMWAWKRMTPGYAEPQYIEVKGDVRLQDVDFGYTPEKQVLHDVSLFAKPGQKIAFVGATGAGKTTITNLINRFYDIADGKIRYDGININHICKPDLRRSLGIVLQDVNLFTGTVMDNIRYGRLDATDEECMEAARLANADDFITRLPEGYNTMLTGNGAQLSQGQRQLISIARAAVADPPVMILDEATSSIDTRTEALVQKGMDNLMKGRTVFVIAHRLSTVRNSDAIMVLDQGRIIERGDHDELIAQKGTYYQLYTGAFELE